MGDTKTDFLNAAKLLLGITNDESDELLSYLIDDCENAVLSYCHIDVLPRQLEGFIPQMAAAMYQERQKGGVKSITEGERHIEYGDTKMDYLTEYAQRLRPFISREAFVPSDKDKGDTKDE
ncbi:MAG: phage head-tail connector protein [Clostridia bacterium]|nr:phage head-tail connector protein [Clostridia bacterium]